MKPEVFICIFFVDILLILNEVHTQSCIPEIDTSDLTLTYIPMWNDRYESSSSFVLKPGRNPGSADVFSCPPFPSISRRRVPETPRMVS